MSNNTGKGEFFDQYQFLIEEKLRITKPGRLTSVHCMDMTTTKGRDGFIGIYDFSGDIIKAHEKAGWIFHSRVTIWKDPVWQCKEQKLWGFYIRQLKKTLASQGMGFLIMF